MPKLRSANARTTSNTDKQRHRQGRKPPMGHAISQMRDMNNKRVITHTMGDIGVSPPELEEHVKGHIHKIYESFNCQPPKWAPKPRVVYKRIPTSV